MTDISCPFCNPDPSALILEKTDVLAIWDRFPSTPGHALILPRRHVSDWFDTTSDEQMSMISALRDVRDRIAKDAVPDGFNIGLNVGKAAGQTIDHVHLHLIPRRLGDVADPRGGVRWVMPETAAYWVEK